MENYAAKTYDIRCYVLLNSTAIKMYIPVSLSQKKIFIKNIFIKNILV